MLEKAQLITLDNGKKYAVVETIDFEENKYVGLINEIDDKDIKFCLEEIEEDKIKLTTVKDINLQAILLGEFLQLLNQESETN